MSVIVRKLEPNQTKEFEIDGVTFEMVLPDRLFLYKLITCKSLDERLGCIAESKIITRIQGATYEDGTPVPPGQFYDIPAGICLQLVRQYIDWANELISPVDISKNGRAADSLN